MSNIIVNQKIQTLLNISVPSDEVYSNILFRYSWAVILPPQNSAKAKKLGGR